ncbi:MAG: acetyl-CoA carboxylase, carboxyltransferase subunit beta, partial [Chlamydiota bacterium]|nr:acetyl-CoA carboxylase, carboxyltransferase subunit beta [Chlamydiota bacterium]
MGFLKLFSREHPKIRSSSAKREGFDGWMKCPTCGEMVHANDIAQSHSCCPHCDHHYSLSVKGRIDLLLDSGSFQPLFTDLKTGDRLGFQDRIPYLQRIEEAKKKSGVEEASQVGVGKLEGELLAFGCLDFSFMGGSMGSFVGEQITQLIEYAGDHRLPLVIISASGGARMQESIFSLMQMAKTSAALARFDRLGLPYLSILTHPTMGGVTASFASLGDIILAEPNALIGFAGPRVVEKTIGQTLPEGAQRAEFLLDKGMIDGIIPRSQMKKRIAFFRNFFKKTGNSGKKSSYETREKKCVVVSR